MMTMKILIIENENQNLRREFMEAYRVWKKKFENGELLHRSLRKWDFLDFNVKHQQILSSI